MPSLQLQEVDNYGGQFNKKKERREMQEKKDGS
jgi:hypothetical protein